MKITYDRTNNLGFNHTSFPVGSTMIYNNHLYVIIEWNPVSARLFNISTNEPHIMNYDPNNRFGSYKRVYIKEVIVTTKP